MIDHIFAADVISDMPLEHRFIEAEVIQYSRDSITDMIANQ